MEKSKRKKISLITKMKIVNDSNVKGLAELSAEYNLPKSTISTILKKKSQVQTAFDNGDVKRCKIRHAKVPELEDQLVEWMKRARNNNLPISGNLLKVIFVS